MEEMEEVAEMFTSRRSVERLHYTNWHVGVSSRPAEVVMGREK
jgi:hypothetical protein